jgi:hypothetical protein
MRQERLSNCVMIGDFGYQLAYERYGCGPASQFAAALTLSELAVPFNTEPEQGIGRQLRRLGHRCCR